MGIYDREYMSDPEPDYRQRRSAVVVLIAINIVIWLLWQFAKDHYALAQFMRAHFLVSAPGVLQDYYLHTLISYAFSHIDIWHIIFNMVFLWFLGRDVEEIYGRANFYVAYIFCAVVAGLLDVALKYLILRQSVEYAVPTLGASGAVMGVAVIAALFDPNKPIYFLGLIRMRLKTLVIVYIVLDVLGLGGAASPSQGPERLGMGTGIAHAAHLGGALGGLLFWKLDLRVFGAPGRRNVGLLSRLRALFRRKPALRVVEKRRGDVAASTEGLRAASATTRPATSVDPETSRRVDELLDKINREGLGALSDDERNFLKESSHKYRKR